MGGSKRPLDIRIQSGRLSPDTMTGDTRAPISGERRELTALFYDLVKSTDLLIHSDLEDYQEIIASFQLAVKQAVQLHGGSVLEIHGDGGMVVFGFPVPSEHHALPAIHAGFNIIATCKQLATRFGRDDFQIRIGIATSDVVVDDPASENSKFTITGIAPTLASRLQTLADPNTVVVSDRTHELTRRYYRFEDRGIQNIKGFEKGEQVWRVTRQRNYAGRFFGSVDIGMPIIGRRTELDIAVRLWRKVMAGHGQMLIVQGEAGVGKTRLLHEIRRRTRSARSRMLVLQCAARGARTALQPIADSFLAARASHRDGGGQLNPDFIESALRSEGIHDSETIETFVALICAEKSESASFGNPPAGLTRQRAYFAARNCLSVWLQEGPVIIAVEDAHWMDPTSRDLLEDMGGWIKNRSVLLVVTTRASIGDLVESAADERIVLDGLSHEEAGELINILWNRNAEGTVPTSAIDLIYEKSNGIPLFLEEIVNLLRDSAGFDAQKLGRFLKNTKIPGFENILSAKLDSLGHAKEVAFAASAIGRDFGPELIQDILGNVGSGTLEDAFDRLVDANLIVRQGSSASPVYGFRHALIQETIYRMLLRRSRQIFHQRIFLTVSETRNIAPWISTAALAEHAERAGMIEAAVEEYVAAGRENSALYAVREARGLLETALDLARKIDIPDKRDQLSLSALSALGPILTSTEGTKSPVACELYEDAVEIARRRPAFERAAWFPIFWGWWFTGANFAAQRWRAQIIMEDLRYVDDPQIQLQIQHCVWAIDFNMGDHDSCIAAVDAGMGLYQSGEGRESYTLYGGHDARVCGLGQKGLSLWFKGRVQSAIVNVRASRARASEIGHLGSIAHALDIEAMLLRYRRAFESLRSVASEMKSLADRFDLKSFHAKAMIFDGWCVGHTVDPERGRDLVADGLAIQKEIGTREDFPVYSEMLAELLSKTGRPADSLALLDEAIEESERTGHNYWLPELYRRRAWILSQAGEDEDRVVRALDESIAIARQQNAIALLLRAFGTLQSLGLSDHADPRVRIQVRDAIAQVEPDDDMSKLIESIASRTSSPPEL